MQAPIVVSVSDKECSIQAVFTADAIAKYEVEEDDDKLIPALVVLVYVSSLVIIWTEDDCNRDSQCQIDFVSRLNCYNTFPSFWSTLLHLHPRNNRVLTMTIIAGHFAVFGAALSFSTS